MLIHRLLFCITIVAVAGCSSPENVQVEGDEISSTAQNEALILQVLDLISERKLDAAMELYAEDYIYHGPGGLELRGRDAIRGLWTDFFNGLPDLTSTVDDLIIQDDKIVLRWTIRGTHKGEFLGFPASNNKITLPITEIFRVADGQLVEAWDQWGHKYLNEQLGANSESADRKKVEHQINAWSAAVNAGDADGIIELVTSDFEMIPPGEDPVSGVAAKQFLRGFFDFDLSLDGKTLELEIAGDLAMRRYSYQLSLIPKGGGETQVLKGQGIHLLRRGPDGLWKFCKDIYN